MYFSDRCNIPPTEDQICKNKQENAVNATQFCNKLIADNRFKSCQNVSWAIPKISYLSDLTRFIKTQRQCW